MIDDKIARESIEDILKRIISDIDEDVDVENLDYNAPLRDQLDLDSMDFLDIVMGLRKEYSLTIPEVDYPELGTMNSGIEYLLRKT